MNDLKIIAEKLRSLKDIMGDPLLCTVQPDVKSICAAIDELHSNLCAALEGQYGSDL